MNKKEQIDPIAIIKKYYDEDSQLYALLIKHSSQVADKALQIIDKHPELMIDREFVYEAAMLHDIGIFLTYAPGIDCNGTSPYICHGSLGSELLQKEGLYEHAMVCERHTGTGLTLKNIIENNLPVPHREMTPISIEEIIICFADKFYSKSKLDKEFSIEKIRKGLLRYGTESVNRFDDWCKLFL